jgi:CDP-diacylglycerol--glycerol-3-phosphate 3-phosphatidyltransferase
VSGLQGFRNAAGQRVSLPVAKLLVKTGVTPNVLTTIGLLINLGAAAAVAAGYFLIGGLLVLLAGLFDLFDGAVARLSNKATRFGALYDSTVDRITEGALFLALAWIFLLSGNLTAVVLAFVAMVGSFLISYIRARSEGLGIECKVGVFTRAERIGILVLGLLFNVVYYSLILLAVLTFVTVIERMVHVWRKSRKTQGERN